MSDILVSLYRILPNPWQTRQDRAGDDAHVQELAADIGARGLLQVPLGRLVTGRDNPQPYDCPLPDSGDLATTAIEEEGCFVQLACGHNRLAAYKLLDGQSPNDGWRRMPVRIAALDDQAMALAAWSENAQRKDLSPWEAALALQRLIVDFGWTQEQVAEHVGLNRATVANKLRLLRLPEDLQKRLHSGDLSERQALALLPVYELPPAAQERLAALMQKSPHVCYAYYYVQKDPAAASSDKVREAVQQAVRVVTVRLKGAPGDTYAYYNRWLPAFDLDALLPGVEAPMCRHCPQLAPGPRCVDPACAERKQAAWEALQGAFPAQATGLPLLARTAFYDLPNSSRRQFSPHERPALDQALAQKCANLRLVYVGPPEQSGYPLRCADYPEFAYACIAEGRCGCAQTAQKEANRQEFAAARAQEKEVRAVREQAIRDLVGALQRQELPAIRAVAFAMVLRESGYTDAQRMLTVPDAGTLWEKMARLAVAREVGAESVAAAQHQVAVWRERVGFVTPGKPDETTEEGGDA